MQDLERLSSELTQRLQACGRVVSVARGASLFERGSLPLAVYQVKRGLIRVSSTSAAGREAVLSVLGAGQWLGETSLFLNEPRLHDAMAVQDSELLLVPTAEFRAVVHDNPAYLRELLGLMSYRYRVAMQWIDRSILLPFPVRLARRLLFEEARADVGVEGAAGGLCMSQQSLGDMLGVSRQSVNKQLKAWERQGVLSLSYGRVHILDAAQLALLGEQEDDAPMGV